MSSFAHRPSTARATRWQAAAAAVAAAAAAALIAILTHGSGSHLASASSASDNVVATAQAFGQALRSRDFATICDQLFTADAKAAEGGSDCASTMKADGVLLQHPRLRVASVSLHGGAATAKVAVTQDHQPTMTETLHMIREGGRFKISGVTSVGD